MKTGAFFITSGAERRCFAKPEQYTDLNCVLQKGLRTQVADVTTHLQCPTKWNNTWSDNKSAMFCLPMVVCLDPQSCDNEMNTEPFTLSRGAWDYLNKKHCRSSSYSWLYGRILEYPLRINNTPGYIRTRNKRVLYPWANKIEHNYVVSWFHYVLQNVIIHTNVLISWLYKCRIIDMYAFWKKKWVRLRKIASPCCYCRRRPANLWMCIDLSRC